MTQRLQNFTSIGSPYFVSPGRGPPGTADGRQGVDMGFFPLLSNSSLVFNSGEIPESGIADK